jgi:hypothetical protein
VTDLPPEPGKVVATYSVKITVRESQVGARAGVKPATNDVIAQACMTAVENAYGSSRVGTYVIAHATSERTDT